MGRNTTPARVDRIVLHIGTEKTGTSSVQHFLSNNRAALTAEGVVYPRFTGANGGSQWGVVAAVLKQPWKMDIGARLGISDEAGVDAYRKHLLEAIDDELLACPKRHTLIFSSEHFHSRLRKPSSLQNLKQLLSRWSDNVQVVVYFRRQDRVAISHYSTKLKTGQAEPRAFPPVKSDSLPYYYDYERIYANWTEVFGEESVQAGLFESQHLAGGDLLTDFCGRVGIAENGKPRPEKVNQSLSETGVQLLLEVNRQWPKPHKSPNPSRELLVASIAREHSGRCFPATRVQAQAFYAHFIDSNARLAKTAFPALEAQLFDEDFSDYPEEPALQLPDLSKEARSRIKAWRAASVTGQRFNALRQLLSARQLLQGAVARSKLLTAYLGGALAQTPAAGLPPVFLHMGLPKTATTTLRNTLFSQHQGICYLGSRKSSKAQRNCASSEIYQALRPILWQPMLPTHPAQVRSVMRAYAEAKGADKPILGSWETQLTRHPKKFQSMLRDARNALGDVRVVVTLRNPLKRLPSAYLHALRECAYQGKHHSIPKGKAFIAFDEWLAGSRRRLTSRHDYRFDFEHNLRFAAKFLGSDKVGIFLFEDMIEDRQGFFFNIQDFMGIDRVDAELIADRHLNKAIKTSEFEFLKTLGDSQVEQKKWLALGNRERRLRMEEIIKAGNSQKYVIALSDAERGLIEARSRDLDRWLVEIFGLDLARHGYPL